MMIKQTSLAIAMILLLGCVGPSQQGTPCENRFYRPGHRDDASGIGDWELIADIRKENPGKLCSNPRDIEAVTLSGLSVSKAGKIFFEMISNLDLSAETVINLMGLCWTKWHNRDRPSGTGDWELLSDLIKENPGRRLCVEPVYIEAATVDGEIPAIKTGESFNAYSPTKGFVCLNQDQSTGTCRDYKVRFGCYCCEKK
ncbi:hypothetical protein ILYODFUR_029953 [Ilyodon furcidens]|uniref:WxxW domain-containing protein n=1 Tax=Ilyodon furcidens TaxID=33524 RepID=A0ABV0T322_9TELE